MSRLLELAKVQLQLLSAIENLTKHWTTIVSLHGIYKSVITDIIKYIVTFFSLLNRFWQFQKKKLITNASNITS